MKGIIDRFEGNYAVVETDDKSTINIPIEQINNALEGDVIKYNILSEGHFEVIIDKKETEIRKKAINNLMNELFID